MMIDVSLATIHQLVRLVERNAGPGASSDAVRNMITALADVAASFDADNRRAQIVKLRIRA